ncbi:MAG: hypothetical protein N2560_02360 [Ignavibacteria bacterium]|nr:hypothetical protein [Ignavibacteria bacterium]
MQINPLNRLTIFFTDLPLTYNSYLNSEKTIISLVINDVNTKLKEDSVVSDGIIKKAELKKFANHIEINIYLKSPRGYSISPLEFSRALMLEVFDWNSLSQAEDNYRMGQLSLGDNLAVARKYFELAFQEPIANAGFFLGYLYLKANLPDQAKQILSKAENLGCNIPDIFSALAQCYYLLNDRNNYEKYKSKFLSEQKVANFKFIEIHPELKDSIFKEFPSLFVEQKKEFSQDSIKTLDTIKISEPTIRNEKSSRETQEKYSFIEKILVFLLVSILVVTILLISLYFKWKKEKKLLLIKKKFENELVKQRQKAIPNKFATQTYKKTEEFSKNEIEEKKQEPEKYINPEIKALAEQIIDSKKAELAQEITEEESSKQFRKKYPPRVEIAMQIQKEQAELIKKKVDSLEISELPTGQDKLEDFAKKFGISKTSLLAKINIEAIEKNKDLYKELYEKFFQKKND